MTNAQPALLERNLRTLWLVLAAALLILAGLIGHDLYHERTAIDTVEREHLADQASVIDQNLAQRLATTASALDSIRQELPWLLAQQDGGTLANKRLQAMAAAMIGVRSFLFIDGSGTAIASNRKELIGRDFHDGERFLAIRQGGDPAMLHVSAPFVTPLGVYAMSVGKVVIDQHGKFSGVVLAILDPEFFRTLLNSVRRTEDTRSSVAHGSGKIIFSTQGKPALAGMDLSQKADSFFNRHLRSGQPATVYSGTGAASDDERLVALRTTRPAEIAMDNPLVIIVSRTASAIYAPWRQQALAKLAMFGLLASVAVIGMGLYQRRQLAYIRLARDREAERKQSDEKLRDSEGRFRALFDTMVEGFGLHEIICDEAGRPCDLRHLMVNPAYERHTGRKAAEVLGRTVRELYPDVDPIWIERYGKVALTGEPEHFQAQFGPLGRWFEVSAYQTEPGQFALVFYDITDRKQAEEALQESKQRLERYNADLSSEVARRTRDLEVARNYFRDFVLRAPIAMGVVEADGRIVLRNDQFMGLFGHDEAAAPTLAQWWELAFPDPGYRQWVSETWAAAVKAAAKEDRAITPVEYRVTCADGKVRHMEISGVTLESGFLATFVDVTERRLAEVELHKRRREAEAANQAKSDFLATMSHEIRTPMNAILGAAQVLERGRLDSEQYQLVGAIRTAGRGLLGIINDVLDLAKIEAGRFELEHSPFVLHNVLSKLVDVLLPSAADKGLALRLSPLPAGVDALLGDAHRLGQVLYNLAGNAIKFTSAGTVTVSVVVQERRPGQVILRFAVRDTGPGIAADKVERLFDAFVQADSSTSRQYGGTGLGLAICRQLVTLMGGEIGVTSRQGEGSEFWFVVPFEPVLLDRDEAAVPVGTAPGLRLAGLRVLVVDDSPVNRDIARRLLALEGAVCETAGDGREALDRLGAGIAGFDAVLMDVQMPEMDGLELTRRIRGELGLTDLPVIALTAGALPSQRERALTAGMDDFIAKPFELDALVAAVQRHAGGKPQPAAAGGGVRPAPVGDSSFPAIPGIDSRRAAQRLQGDRGLFLSALRALRDEFADAPHQVRDDLARGARETAYRRLHKLRGAAGNLSAETVASLAGQLEDVLRRNEPVVLETRLDALASALDEVMAGLPAGIDALPPGEDGGSGEEIDPADMEKLLAALAENDLKALRLFDGLRARLAARHGGETVVPLAQALEQLRFEAAYSLLRAWHPAPPSQKEDNDAR